MPEAIDLLQVCSEQEWEIEERRKPGMTVVSSAPCGARLKCQLVHMGRDQKGE